MWYVSIVLLWCSETPTPFLWQLLDASMHIMILKQSRMMLATTLMPFFLGLEAGFMDFLGPKGFKSHFFRTSTKVGLFCLSWIEEPMIKVLVFYCEFSSWVYQQPCLPFIDYLKTANPFSLCRKIARASRWSQVQLDLIKCGVDT